MLSVYCKSYVNCESTEFGNQLIESLVEFVKGLKYNKKEAAI